MREHGIDSSTPFLCEKTSQYVFDSCARYEKWRKIATIVAQAIGCAAAFALIMIGVFSEDSGSLHDLWSSIFFLLNLIVLILVGASLFTHPRYKRGIAYYGFIVAAINLIFVFVSDTPSLEWFTVFTALGCVGLISYNMARMQPSVNIAENQAMETCAVIALSWGRPGTVGF
jgi:hypothetical membrane protein